MNRLTSQSLAMFATLFSTAILAAQPPLYQDPVYPSSTFDNPIVDQPVYPNEVINGSIIGGTVIDGTQISGTPINGTPIQGGIIGGEIFGGEIVGGEILDGGVIQGSVVDVASLPSLPSKDVKKGLPAQNLLPALPEGASVPKVEKQSVRAGQGSGLWKWTPRAAYHQSIVEVETSGGNGTGVVIQINKDKPVKDGFEGYVITAWHVIRDDITDGKIKVTYRNKRRAKGCQVVQYDEDKDIAVLWVWVPGEITPAKLATQSIKRGDKLELAGLGGGTDLACCIRAFEASASPPSNKDKIFADVPLLPGDSGGPVFNADNEVVGIISGGWFWWDSGLKTPSGGYIQTTWPARASNVGPIQSLMAKVKKGIKPSERMADAGDISDKR